MHPSTDLIGCNQASEITPGNRARSEANMAEPKLKGEQSEKAIAKLVAQMPKELAKRKWKAATHAALVSYLVEACGGKFDKPESRQAFRTIMEDSDWSFSSNMKKYFVLRGFLPKEEVDETQKFE